MKTISKVSITTEWSEEFGWTANLYTGDFHVNGRGPTEAIARQNVIDRARKPFYRTGGKVQQILPPDWVEPPLELPMKERFYNWLSEVFKPDLFDANYSWWLAKRIYREGKGNRAWNRCLEQAEAETKRRRGF